MPGRSLIGPFIIQHNFVIGALYEYIEFQMFNNIGCMTLDELEKDWTLRKVIKQYSLLGDLGRVKFAQSWPRNPAASLNT